MLNAAGADVAPNIPVEGAGLAGVEPNAGAAGTGAAGVETRLAGNGAIAGVPPKENPDDAPDAEALSVALSPVPPNANDEIDGVAAGAVFDVEPKEKLPGAGVAAS